MLVKLLKPIVIMGLVVPFEPSISHAEKLYKTEAHSFVVQEVVRGLRNPWGVAFLPSGDILVTEKNKKQLRLIRKGKLVQTPIAGLPGNIDSSGQGGLLDVTAHPNFEKNRLIYFSYSGVGKNGKGTEVAKAKLVDARLEDVKVIFKVAPKTRGSLHYGSRLQFADDGTLFVTTGDRYSFLKEAQNPANHLGSVLRINDDGSIPEDNPFVGHKTFKAEIFSFGHRNGQGLAFNPIDKTMWMHEHGPRGGDEVNKLDKAGANYGWPATTYGVDYSGAIISDKTDAPGITPPILHWTPSIAPSGMAFYNGEQFPDWRGNLFVGSLVNGDVRRLVLKDDKVAKQEIVLTGLPRVRDVKSGPDGFIYVLTDSYNGQLLRLKPGGS